MIAWVRVCKVRVPRAKTVVTQHLGGPTLGFEGYSTLERNEGKELSFGERSQRAMHCVGALLAVLV